MADPHTAHVATHSSPLLVVLAWAIVILPTAWGLNYTVQNALKIFTAPPPATAAPPPASTRSPTAPAAKP
ncbi:MAG: hypothetical protein M3O02_01115 [Acidobacteriota bacterium]|nr:hypothetical protein [Acidobacteriota bacterium]